jgi:predicted signal transduction protein with EAL and GGDEF domain
VETLKQLDRLRMEGCTEVQGYFFSRPRPASEVQALIERLQQLGQGANSVKAAPMNALGSKEDVSRTA